VETGAYLLSRGDTRAALDLANNLRQYWRQQLGADHQDTLAATNNLAWELYQMGRYVEARDLEEDTLNRLRRILGDNDPNTLNSANNLSALGEKPAARDLEQDTLARRRRILGDDHPDIPRSERNLAIYQRQLGEADA
jgi:tetratricopeptide (TPR) repeat protein